MPRRISPPVLSTRVLNRTLLRRQSLLARERKPVLRAVEDLVGMQAQIPSSPYISLWSRLDGFDPSDLSAAIEERRAVRLTLLRATIHLVTARDCIALRGIMQPHLERVFRSTPFAKNLRGVDLEELAAAGRVATSAEAMTLTQLRAALGRAWPRRDANSLAYAMHYLVPQVQVPPRGLWGRSAAPRWMTVESFLGKPVDRAASPQRMVARYLAAYGPANVADIAAWSGMRGVREIVDAMRARLRVVRDENGRELFDVPRGLPAGDDIEAPPRFLPEYDNVLLAHADRTRVLSEDVRRRGVIGKPTVLVDGFVAGTWQRSTFRGRAAVTVEPMRTLSSQERRAVEEEGEALLAFLAPGERSAGVRFAR